MYHFPYPSYLRTHRKRWALTQRELAALLGARSASQIAEYELLAHDPNAEALIAFEFIFGEPARRIFPALYASVEVEVTRNSAFLAEALAGRNDPKALVQRELIESIARRAASDKATI
jgi:transcriptional regulator with XRE-family HTH domain